MDATSLLKSLVEHLRWADLHVHAALTDADDPPADAVRLYAHLIAAEAVWLDRVEDTDPTVAVWPRLDLSEIRSLAEESHERLQVLAATLEPDREVSYRNSRGQAFTNTVADILTHVALHGAYHRGQVARALREAGFVPAPTDFIAFVRGVPAARTVDTP